MPAPGIYTGLTGPLIYGATGGIATPMDGIPLEVADRSFNRKHSQVVVGNGLYGGPAAAGAAGGFTLTELGTGSVALNNSGQLVLTTGATDENNENLQFLGLPFVYSATKKFWVFGRFAVSTAANVDFFFGLHESATAIILNSALNNSAPPTPDCIGFFKAATATDLSFIVAKNNTGVSTPTAMGLTLTNGGFFICGFTITAGVIRAFAVLDPNDALLTNPGLLGNGLAVANTNAPNTVDTFLSIVAGTEGAVARTVTCPWAFACAEHA